MAQKNRCIRVSEPDWSLWNEVADSKGQSVTRMLKSAVVAYAGLKKPVLETSQVQMGAYAPEPEVPVVSVERTSRGYRVVCGEKQMVLRGKQDESDAVMLFGPDVWRDAQSQIKEIELG